MNRFFFVLFGLVFIACGKPIADFAYSGKQEAPAKIKFEKDAKEGESYEWDFGDGNKSSEVSPEHRYATSGNYTVVLKVTKGEKSASEKKDILIESPEQCYVEIQTDFGNMLILLYDATPQHRDNFIKLAEEGFYDDLIFHRVIAGFMIQGGDPNSRNAKSGQRLGTGGPGYQIPAEFVDSLVHTKGAVAAARTNNPEKKSSGSQFYIVQGRKITERQLNLTEAKQDFNYSSDQKKTYLETGGTPQLDREYTVFGRVVEGLEVIDKIAAVQTGPADRPKKDVKMKIRVIK